MSALLKYTGTPKYLFKNHDRNIRTTQKVSLELLELNIYFHTVTKCVCKWYTVEILTVYTVVNRTDVKHDDQSSKQTDRGEEADYDANLLPTFIHDVESDVWKERKWQQKSKDEADKMGVIVDPRKKTNDKEEKQKDRELSDRPDGTLQDTPALKDLDEKASENSELRPSWTSLNMIRKKNGAGKTSSDSTHHVDDHYSEASAQLFNVTHYDHLEETSYQKLD